MNGQSPLISVRGLGAAYGGAEVLRDVSFDVYPGEIFVILGGSGSGKSTLLKHMIGLYRPKAGAVLFQGRDLVTARGEERRNILRSFGVMYQGGALFGSMSLLENVRLPLEEFTDLPGPAMDLVCRMKLHLVGLSGFGGHLPAELSGGMLKRAAIARAMALDPSILFLDEPSAGLDPITSAELDALIRRLSRTLNVTFVIVTHELESIFAVADRVIMLDKETKNIVATGDPQELKARPPTPWVGRFLNRELAPDEPAAARTSS